VEKTLDGFIADSRRGAVPRQFITNIIRDKLPDFSVGQEDGSFCQNSGDAEASDDPFIWLRRLGESLLRFNEGV
jgi:hypothetical protein